MDFGGKGVCVCGKEMKGSGGSFGPLVGTTWRKCDCGITALFYHISEDTYELVSNVERKDKAKVQKEEQEKLLNVFKLANIEVLKYWEIKNEYSGDKADWLLVKTPLGLIKIGWRKRVVNIDWSDTGIKYLTKDDVTKDEYFCHAWSYEKAVSYLTKLVREIS